MSMQLTAEQKLAIETIDRDLAVSAGAGSGKTRVLVERYVHLINQGIKVSEIVAITFTKKAAQEMKERIRSRLPARAESLEHSNISTIHSFCQKVIREHPREAGIDPQFRMAEEWETDVLLYQIVSEVIEEHLEEGDSYIAEWTEEYRSEADLISDLLRVYQQMLGKGQTNFQVPDQDGKLATELSIALTELESEVEKLFTFCAGEKLTAKQQDAISELQTEWPSIQDGLRYGEDTHRQEALWQINDILKGIRGKFREITGPVQELAAEIIGDLDDLKGHRLLCRLGKILGAVHARFEERKRAYGILDFNDLELLMVKLLAMPEVRAHYLIRHLMIDEFQDTNRLQKQIIDLLKTEDTCLFIVGDPKQSIYRFRGAEVEVFLQTQQEIRDRNGLLLSLRDNFRSEPGIIQFSNSFFERLLKDDPIGFESSIWRRSESGLPNVQYLCTTTQDESLSSARELEAQCLARKIWTMVNSEKKASYGHISVLFRTMSNVRYFEKAFQELGVPYVNLSSRGFYSRQEIVDILNFITWLRDPEDLVAKVAVLRSAFFLVSDEALYWYVHGITENIEQKELQKLETAERMYKEFQKMLQVWPAPKFIGALISETKLCQTLSEMSFGEQRVANIHKFHQQSWNLWSRGIVSVLEQLRYIELIVSQKDQEGEANLDGEEADVVKIRTIHGSKGLEFPVTILADISGQLQKSDAPIIRFHPDYGMAVKGTRLYDIIKTHIQEEELRESKRLLYVAVTRAEKSLIFSSLVGYKPRGESWWQWLEAWRLEEPGIGEVLDGTEYCSVQAGHPKEDGSLTTAARRDAEQLNALPAAYGVGSISVTSLMVFAECPRRYYFRYVLQVPEIIQGIHDVSPKFGETKSVHLSPLEKGNIVHRVCEHINSTAEKDELISWAAQMEGVTLRAGDTKEVQAIVDKYLVSEYFRRIKSHQGVQRELEFIVPLGDFLITGTVDQAFDTPEGLVIVDLKTNNISQQEVQKVGQRYSWQLKTYAWALHKLLKKPVKSGQLYFLMPNEIYIHPNAHFSTEEVEIELLEMCENIRRLGEAGWENLPHSHKKCRNCGYSCDESLMPANLLFS